MNISQYKKLENELNEECKLKLYKLRNEYVDKYKKYNIGDYIFNVTGIVKVETISCKNSFDNIEIVYSGHRYKKWNGVLSRTNDKKISSMVESDIKNKLN